MSALPIVRTVADLRQTIATWRAAGDTVALVPTMGALHAGHLSLVTLGQRLAKRVVVSIFVNPTQFGPNEDFSRYPRQEAADHAALASVGADLIYAPSVTEMYPPGAATTVTVSGVTEGLCGAFRPGHFAGVATIVAKLLLQALPDTAIFGEKDYQQLQVIRRLVRDLDIPVRIEGGAILRDEAGLALSSRNAYLSAAELAIARRLNRVLDDVLDQLRQQPTAVEAALESGKAALLAAGFARLDYLQLCDADSLSPLTTADRPARLLVAAWLGKTRLIDNKPL